MLTTSTTKRGNVKLISFMISFAAAFLLLAFTLNAQSSNSMIKGKVIDKDANIPLVGASVSVPSLRLGAITNKNGEFQFSVPPGEHTVEVKFVGYETRSKRVVVDDGKTAEVTFELTTQSIRTNQIVVVGLTGEVDRDQLGTSISSVSNQDVAKVVSSSAIDAINGRVAGVHVTKNSGTPGAGTYITLRGRKTISGSSEPLYIVDGIIIDNTSLYSGSGTHSFANRAVDINPQDIESIEILKGASAAAIYGSQAANGVVIITTKRGRLSSYDKPAKINFSQSIQFDDPTGSVPLQTTYGQSTPYQPGIPGSSDSYGDPLPEGTETYAQDQVPFRTGISSISSLTITGGVPEFDYMINGTYEDVQGYVEGSQMTRTSVRANVGVSLFPGVSLQTNNNFIMIDNDMPQDGSNVAGILLGALRTPPEFNNEDYLEPDGSQRRFGYYDNPIWTQKMNTYNAKTDRFLSSTQLKWQPADWINIKGLYGLDVYNDNHEERLAVGSAGSDNRAGYISRTRINNFRSNLDLIATLSHRFFDDRLSSQLVMGSQMLWYERENVGSDASNTLPFFDQLGAGSTRDADSRKYESKKVGLFAQLTNTWADKLTLTLAIRRDGSSTFGDAEQFHYYPKIGLSYVLSNEKFMESTKDILSYARLRAAYGEAGSPDLPGIYATNFLYGTAGNFDPWVNSSNNTRGGYIGIRQGGGTVNSYIVAGAKDINPELSIEREIGLDLGFFDDMISLEATYFFTNVYDMIVAAPVAASTGYDRVLKNASDMWNEGIELALNATPVNNEYISWRTGFNYSTITNELTRLDINPNPTGNEFYTLGGGFVGINNAAIVGEQLGVFRTYGWLRDENGNVMYSYWDEEEGAVVGDDFGLNYVGAPRQDPSLVLVGDPNPDFMFSWHNDITIMKNLTLSFLIDVVWGFDVWNGTRGALYNFGTSGDTEDRDEEWINMDGQQVMDYNNPNYDPETYDPNDPSTHAVGPQFATPATNLYKYKLYYNGFVINEPHIEDGSFIKFRELVLEYRFDGLKKWNIDQLVLTAAVRNLLTISDYSGYDPEVNTFSLAEGRGFDYFTLPQTRSFRIGLSIIY